MGEFITCGTLFKSDSNTSGQVKKKNTRNISKDKQKNKDAGQVKGPMTDLEKQMLNNEYLKILKDPRFSDLNVNFLEF